VLCQQRGTVDTAGAPELFSSTHIRALDV
jgi:hypothetical protein